MPSVTNTFLKRSRNQFFQPLLVGEGFPTSNSSPQSWSSWVSEMGCGFVRLHDPPMGEIILQNLWIAETELGYIPQGLTWKVSCSFSGSFSANYQGVFNCLCLSRHRVAWILVQRVPRPLSSLSRIYPNITPCKCKVYLEYFPCSHPKICCGTCGNSHHFFPQVKVSHANPFGPTRRRTNGMDPTFRSRFWEDGGPPTEDASQHKDYYIHFW